MAYELFPGLSFKQIAANFDWWPVAPLWACRRWSFRGPAFPPLPSEAQKQKNAASDEAAFP